MKGDILPIFKQRYNNCLNRNSEEYFNRKKWIFYGFKNKN